MKLRINASDKDSTNKQDRAIADTCGNKSIIPLDCEMLESMMPYYQTGLGHRLSYEITFNNYNRAIISPGSPPKPDAEPQIKISLEYDIVTQPDLASRIEIEYQSMSLPYDRILRKTKVVNKWDIYGMELVACKSFKGIPVFLLNGRAIQTRPKQVLQLKDQESLHRHKRHL